MLRLPLAPGIADQTDYIMIPPHPESPVRTFVSLKGCGFPFSIFSRAELKNKAGIISRNLCGIIHGKTSVSYP